MKREEPSTESPGSALAGIVVFGTPIGAVSLCPSPSDRGLSHSGCQAFSGTGLGVLERPWSRVVWECSPKRVVNSI